jgi:diguanylate cyclase (GGDEF)-like protein/PAS domain S-box-containing protein
MCDNAVQVFTAKAVPLPGDLMPAARIATKTKLIFGCAALMVVITMAIAYRSTRRHLDTLALVMKTVDARRTIAETLAAAQDMEAGVRGGNDRAQRLLADLRRLTAGDARQQQHLDQLEVALRARILSDDLRARLRAMDDEESRLMTERERDAGAAEWRALASRAAVLVVAMALAFTWIYRISRDRAALAAATRKLRASEAKFRRLADHATDLVLLVDQSGRIHYASPASERLLGHAPDAILGTDMLALVHDDDRARIARHTGDILSSRDPSAAVRFRLRRKDNQHRWFESRTFIVEEEETRQILFQHTARDVHNEALAEEELARSREVYRTLVCKLPKTAVLVYDRELRCQLADGLELLGSAGLTKAEIEGHPVETVVPPENRDMATRMFRASIDGRATEFEVIRGEQILNFKLSSLRIEGLEPVGMAVARDVTDERHTEDLLASQTEELRSLSLRDELTGLHNRRGFITLAGQHMKMAARQRAPFAILFIDLNELKPINDTLGHQAGDDALKDTAALLRGTFRDSDLLARFGGDEFAVLAADVRPGPESAAQVLARLDAAVEHHNRSAERPFRLSISVGMVHYDPAKPASIDDLLAEADKRMYEEKRARKVERGRVTA